MAWQSRPRRCPAAPICACAPRASARPRPWPPSAPPTTTTAPCIPTGAVSATASAPTTCNSPTRPTWWPIPLPKPKSLRRWTGVRPPVTPPSPTAAAVPRWRALSRPKAATASSPLTCRHWIKCWKLTPYPAPPGSRPGPTGRGWKRNCGPTGLPCATIRRALSFPRWAAGLPPAPAATTPLTTPILTISSNRRGWSPRRAYGNRGGCPAAAPAPALTAWSSAARESWASSPRRGCGFRRGPNTAPPPE